MEQYLPAFLFILVAVALASFLLILNFFVAKKDASGYKNAPFECGFEPFSDTRNKFDVRFYLVAILFILFDLEVAFFFPWVLVKSQLGWSGLGTMGVFLFILMVGFAYEWKQGALEWE